MYEPNTTHVAISTVTKENGNINADARLLIVKDNIKENRSGSSCSGPTRATGSQTIAAPVRTHIIYTCTSHLHNADPPLIICTRRLECILVHLKPQTGLHVL